MFAGAAGVGTSATVDAPLVLPAVPAATLLLANLAAAAPGRAAAALRPAAALRTE